MKYQYHSGPIATLDYDLLKQPMDVWPNCEGREYSPLIVVQGWYWPAESGGKVSLKNVRKDITNTFDLDNAIDVIIGEWKVEYIGEAAGVVFTGNGTDAGPMSTMFPHVHAPVKEFNYKRCPNLTVIVPVKIVEPVTEEFCVKHYDYIPWDKVDCANVTQDDWLHIAENLTTDGDVTRIKLPDAGQYLAVEFEGSHDFHWVEHISNNHYLYLILEGHINES